MKVNELRVGNLLDNGYGIVQVSSISLDIDDEYNPTIGVCKLGEHRNEIIVNEAAFGIEVKPIPLTPEWLAKCGFNKLNAGWINSSGSMCFYDRARDMNGYYTMDYGTRNYVARFKNVHQLQNLFFALTGEELNVKL